MNWIVGIALVVFIPAAVYFLYRPEILVPRIKLIEAEKRGDEWYLIFETDEGTELFVADTLEDAFRKAYRAHRFDKGTQ